MKFGQVREHNKIFFIKNRVEYKAERLVPDLFLFLIMLYMRQNQMLCSLFSISFDSPQLGVQ